MTVQANFLNAETKAIFNMKSIRLLVYIITSMLIVLAMTMIILASAAYWHYYEFEIMYENAPMGRYITTAGLCIFIGVMLLFVCTFGFYGSVKKRTSMVNSYACMLIVLYVFQVLAIYLAFTLNKRNINNNLYFPIWNFNNKWQEIDRVQDSLSCCGEYDYTDYQYLGIEFNKNVSTIFVRSGDTSVQVPSSCCATWNLGLCEAVNRRGCKRALFHVMEHHALILGMMSIAMKIISLLAIIFAVLLARCIRNMKSEKVLTAWKVKEHVIMAREKSNESANHTVNSHFEASMA